MQHRRCWRAYTAIRSQALVAEHEVTRVPIRQQTQPFTLQALGVDQTLQLTLDISDRQLHLIEELRTDGVELYLNMSGYVTQDGQQLQVAESQISHEISQSDWITLLQRGGLPPGSAHGTRTSRSADSSRSRRGD